MSWSSKLTLDKAKRGQNISIFVADERTNEKKDDSFLQLFGRKDR